MDPKIKKEGIRKFKQLVKVENKNISLIRSHNNKQKNKDKKKR